MPPAKPPEFRRRAIALARAGDQSMDRIVADLGIAESCLRRWLKQDDLDSGRRSDGLISDVRQEWAELRRRNRTLEMEVEILKRASAYFARENVLPK
jgi:transposase